MKRSKVLITGTAGFIGFHLAEKLLKLEEYEVIGLDVINDYYDLTLKYDRLKYHGIQKNEIKRNTLIPSKKYQFYSFIQADLADHNFIVEFMIEHKFDYVINLAAQAGVRYSIDNPRAYTHSNIDGFLSVLEGSKITEVKHLLYASTSSAYGLNTKMPLSEDHPTEHPMAIYAATKKANELMAHSYSHLFHLPTTGLRFFTVYGPWGRPDMALFLFVDAIKNNRPIKVFNNGQMIRDFTYVDDIVHSISLLLKKPPIHNKDWDSKNPVSSSSSAPYSIFNIGNSSPVGLMSYIEAIEESLEKTAEKTFLEMQPGDVPATHADTSKLEEHINYKPQTSIKKGVGKFVEWFNTYYD
ncbi:MAG: GDP-mannose 4,6-dehydratase [Flavobacteriaceae bacterium]|nr:GDP-mannose 4,6-dehydratase [Flavobacteriaceae bacterium]